MNEQEWENMIDNTQRYAIENSNKKVETTGYRTMFNTLLVGSAKQVRNPN